MAEDVPELEPPDDESSETSSRTDESAVAEPGVVATSPRASRRTLAVGAGLVGLVAIIALDVSSMLHSARSQTPSVAASVPAKTQPAAAASPPSPEPGPDPDTESAAVPSDSSNGGAELFQDMGEEEPSSPEPVKPKAKKGPLHGTVREAAARRCSTSSVDGLSRQIIARARCIDPRAFVAVPGRPNLNVKSNVFFYLEAPARDHLLKALDANRKKTMTVHSALRTVAQQYLLRRWALGKRCGIELATPPGDSNHETGLALDISEYGAWRSALEAEGFRWLGSIDRVHFDYKGPGAASHSSVDVKAFQQLWNANNPDDKIPENGRYTPDTEDRLEKSPANGFPRGARCN